MPLSALDGPYGIGTMGSQAREFIDFLARAGQKYWQILPLGPTGYGDSPYQAFSSFAGNPYFIDLDELVAEGLLDEQELLLNLLDLNDTVYFGSHPSNLVPMQAYLPKHKKEMIRYVKETRRQLKGHLDEFPVRGSEGSILNR